MGYDLDSFDRFGDQLCELILSYLSVEEKLMYECVSKQWKRFIFNKQQKLIVDYYMKRNNNINTTQNCLYLYEKKVYFWDILKKLKFINEMQTFGGNIELLYIITNYCNCLEKISCDLKFDYKDLIDFGLLCGQKLRSIHMRSIGDKELASLLNLTPNLETIVLNNTFDPLVETFLPKLKEIVFLSHIKDLKVWELITDKYHKQIKTIRVGFASEDDYSLIVMAFKQLSRFESLQKLTLDLIKGSFDRELTEIAINCKKLRQLYINANDLTLKRCLFEVLGEFHSLDELSISCRNDFYGNIGNIVSLANCENLKFLEMDINGLSDENFEGIHLFLSNLKQISLVWINNTITDITLENLSKLQKLTKLSIRSEWITNTGMRDLIKIGPKIRSIYVNEVMITDQSVEAFIEKANNNPKIQYEFIAFERENCQLIISDITINRNLLIKRSIQV